MNRVALFSNKLMTYKYMKNYFQKYYPDLIVVGCNMYFPESASSSLLSFEEITEMDCKLVIIIAEEEEERNSIVSFLINQGYSKDRIFDFYKLYKASIPKLNIERLMHVWDGKVYEGIILGISHAEVGIVTNYMKHNFINIAVSHQDLYYNLCTLKYLAENYPDSIKELKYAIIDLFDYTYFNYDTSLSENAGHYYLIGGYNLDRHHFDKNKNFEYNFDEIIYEIKKEWYKNITENEIDIWEKFFLNFYEYENYKCFQQVEMQNRNQVVNQFQIANMKYGSILDKVFNNTIEENISILEEILNTLQIINPSIKVYGILLPRVCDVEVMESTNPKMKNWKKLFLKIINMMQNKYAFEFIDLKGVNDISSRKEYYQDTSHLNALGSYVMTNYIENLIYKEV